MGVITHLGWPVNGSFTFSTLCLLGGEKMQGQVQNLHSTERNDRKQWKCGFETPINNL